MASITGALAELIVDTDKMVVVVHDGSTAGGFPLASADNPEFSGNASFNALKLGNSTANVFVNSTMIQVANSTRTLNVFSNRIKTGNSTVNTTAVAVGSNLVVNTSTVKIGNSTVNATANSTELKVSNGSTNTVMGTGSVQTDELTVRSNTYSLGSSNNSANGFMVMSNGIMKAWGVVQANDSVGDIDFEAVFNDVWGIQVTPRAGTYDSTYMAMVTAMNTTTANVRTGNQTAIDVYYEVIGNNA